MYELTIVTEYNIIHLVVDDYNSLEVKEILEQPYVKSVEWHQIKEKTKVRRKEDEMARNRKDET